MSTGTTGDDNIQGTLGDDTIDGLAGNDYIDAGPGNDTVQGGDGNDSIFGYLGDDSLMGGAGDDWIAGEQGNDYIDGGPGTQDAASYVSDPAGANVNLQTGHAIDGWGGSDTLTGIEMVVGSSGNDTITGDANTNYFMAGPGNDFIVGGDGVDDLMCLDATSGVQVNLQTGQATGGGLGNDTLSSIEYVIGSNFADRIILADDSHGVQSLGGDDSIDGGAGDEVFAPGTGNDTVNGHGGIDMVYFNGNRAQYTITKTATGWTSDGTVTGEGTDTYTNIERLNFIDTNVALDLDGNAGEVAKILGAVFGAATVHNPWLVGAGLHYADTGMTYESLMQLALTVALGPNATNAQVVDLLYANVVGQAPTPGAEAYFISLIDNHTFTQASLAVVAADLSLNTDRIGLPDLAQHGLAYF